jgi:hypothetical protein
MSGWIRIGIALTVLWVAVVSSYAIHEFTAFPLTSGDSTKSRSDYENEAKKFYFVTITTRYNYETISAEERQKYDTDIKNEKDDEWRKTLIGARNMPVSWPTLSDTFFTLLAVTVAAFWVTAYLTVTTTKWIIKGFKIHRKL